MKFSRLIKVTGLTFGLFIASSAAPNFVTEQLIAHANSISEISTKDYDSLDPVPLENTIDLSELRQITVQAVLEEVNNYRTQMGVKPLEAGADIVQEMTYKHARYIAIESDYSHYETKKGSKYFVGESFSDRLATLGDFQKNYTYFAENISFPNTWETKIMAKYMLHHDHFNKEHYTAYVKDQVRGLIDVPYHGSSILSTHAEYLNVDMYLDKDTVHGAFVVTLYADRDLYQTDKEVFGKPYFYPYDGQKEVNTHMTKDIESPDPVEMAGLDVSGKPLIAYSYYPKNSGSNKMIEASSAIVTNLVTNETIETIKLDDTNTSLKHFAVFVPVEKFEEFTPYKVTYTYIEPNGNKAEYTTTFTTGKARTLVKSIEATSPQSYIYNGETYRFSDVVEKKETPVEDTADIETPEDSTYGDIISVKDSNKLALAKKEAIQNFADFKENAYWADAVVWLYANEIMTGSELVKKDKKKPYATRQFMPNSKITELHMLAMMFRYTSKNAIPTFQTNDSDWGYVYYEMAKAIGLETNGDNGPNRSKGNKPITREEMAKILVQTITGQGMTGKNAIQWLYDHEISTGTQDINGDYPKTYASFKPHEQLTRVHVAAFLYRTQQQVEAGNIKLVNHFE